MSTPPDAVLAATDRLMNALALDEDSRDTVQSVLHDLWDDARTDAEAPTATSNADAAGWNEPRTDSPAWGA